MSLIPRLSTRKIIPAALVVAIGVLLAATLSQKVESAGDKMQAAAQTKGKGVVTEIQKEQPAKFKRFPNVDIRSTEPQTMSKIAAANAGMITQRLQTSQTSVEQALNRLRSFSRGVQAKASPLTGAVEIVRSTTGVMSGPAMGRSGPDIVRGFISANSDLYGLSSKDIAALKFSGESMSGSGMRMVRVEQIVNGLPVFQSETRFILDPQGRVLRSTGLLIPNANTGLLNFDGLMSAQVALSMAMNSIDIHVDSANASLTNANINGTEVDVVSTDPNIAGNVTSKLVY